MLIDVSFGVVSLDDSQGRILASADVSGPLAAHELIPRMSPLLLRVLLSNRKAILVSPAVDAILDEVFFCGAVDNWLAFERFHALYECLRHTLLSAESTPEWTTLGDLYPGALVRDGHLNGASILKHKIRIRPRSLIELKAKLPHLTQENCAQYLEHVVLACTGNAGFDIAVPIEKEECVLIEARYSNPDANTYVRIAADAVAKRELILASDTTTPGACGELIVLSVTAIFT